MTRQFFIGLLVAATLAGAAGAQCTLSTGFPGGNGLTGNMFDVVNPSAFPITITSLDINVNAASHTVTVWFVTGGGTMVGKNASPALWTQAGLFNNVTGAGPGIPTVLPPLTTPITIPPGGTQGIYVTIAAGTMTYTNGTTVGAIWASDCFLQILHGYGIAPGFPTTFNSPRNWNGILHYTCPAVTSDWQINQAPIAALDINNVQALVCLKASTTHTVYGCSTITPATGTIRLASNRVGLPWDLVLSGVNLVGASGGGITLPDGQIINLNTAAPLTFLNGILASNWPGTGIPGLSSSALTVGYSLGAQTGVSFQGIFVDPTAASGVRLTQGAELHVNLTAPLTTSIVPPADNTTTAIDVTAPPYCWAPSGIPFYGTNYTTMHVLSNGRVMFGAAGNTVATPTVATFASNNPSVGVWTDWNPAILGGSITAQNLGGGIIRVNYSVAYAGETLSTLKTFGIQFDTVSGAVTLDGLTGIGPNPQGTAGGAFLAANDSMIMGISRGATGATTPAATVFTAAGSGVPANATDMWYDWYLAVNPGAGLCPSLAPGTLNGISFTPNPALAPNYNWAGF